MKYKENGQNIRRILNDLAEMNTDTSSCFSAGPVSLSNLLVWKATIFGPEGTPYEGGSFEFDIIFPTDYPYSPPKVRVCTKIFHCNIKDNYICLDIIGKQWSSALTISKVLLSITSLLADPNPSDPLDTNISQLYLRDKQEYLKIAREWTQKYAML
ncbi:ubiquitin-conjugating enzyme E2 D [Nematocida sp. LUAm1]|nr:ubiquitin-conjugating enzyme E2 D [Nematocida sp. LUAm2]KAI5179034.1 ubiquitin-conjugating enzyme E2 D [Nematocida sp. LUAm1]